MVKWLEVMTVVTSTKSQITVQKLRVIFETNGQLEVVISDNASCFTSDKYNNFMPQNGIQHITSASYHPAD